MPDRTPEGCVLSLSLFLISCQIWPHLSTAVFHLILRLSRSSLHLSARNHSTLLHVQELSKTTRQALVKIEQPWLSNASFCICTAARAVAPQILLRPLTNNLTLIRIQETGECQLYFVFSNRKHTLKKKKKNVHFYWMFRIWTKESVCAQKGNSYGWRSRKPREAGTEMWMPKTATKSNSHILQGSEFLFTSALQIPFTQKDSTALFYQFSAQILWP